MHPADAFVVQPVAPRYVWILGAGFSRPLGGPLLRDLLSENMAEEIIARFQQRASVVQDRASRLVYYLYRLGLRGADPEESYALAARAGMSSTATKREIWNDAEEFLQFLDIAARDPGGARARRIGLTLSDGEKTEPPVPVADLGAAARRIVAAECAAFLHDEHVEYEPWLPYRDWAAQLNADHTIVTFNYDRVFESLQAWMISDGTAAPNFSVRLPGEVARPGGARVLKLHGSVDWIFSADHNSVSRASPAAVVDQPGAKIAIGMPGPAKEEATLGPFAPLWRAAERAIEEASEIWFVGYSFPQTDALARQRILEAVRRSRAGSLHVVLGSQNPDAARVENLLLWASRAPGSPVRVHPLGAQDVLERWRPHAP